MWKSRILMTVLAVCVLCLSACATAAKPAPTPASTKAPEKGTPTETPALEPAEAPETAAAVPTQSPRMTYPQPVEVILAGPSGKISSVVDTARAEGIELTLVGDRLPLDGIDVRLSGWTMEVYGVVDARAPIDPLKNWERVGDVVGIAYEKEVLADPNYVLAADSTPAPQVIFSPYHGGESPFGSPQPSPPNAFEQQWAFGAQPGGVGPVGAAGCQDTATVFVFDTPPRKDYGLFSQVTNFAPASFTTGATTAGCSGDHGLFVSDLIKRVAPNAGIELYPVLDTCGAGPLSTLDWALVDVLLRLPADGSKPSILNLSLGIQEVVPPCFSGAQGKDAAGKACPRFWEDPKWPQVRVLDLCVFDTLLYLFREKGGIIVAAAGNDSFEAPNKPKQMQIPAAYDRVIGVVGNTMDGKRSCFSNLAKLSDSDFWVSAPAGEGDGSAAPQCEPASALCANNPNPSCPYALVGKVYGNASEPQYAYWTGTSFAAPLVTGLAACALASCGTACSGPNPTKNPTEEVFRRIKCGAGQTTTSSSGALNSMSPGRVISIPKSLSSACP